MLNYLWGFMIMIGLGYGIITGEVEALSNAAIDSAGEAVTLAVTMLGIMAMWTGLMKVARQAGLMERMTGGLRPVLHLLFPRIPEGHKAREYIAANIIANVLGLGWAATPMGLKAMKELAVIERERLAKQRGIKPDDIEIKKASDEMCTFLVINISSLQLIPVSVIAYRAAIVLPGLIATLVSTVVAVMFCRVMCRKGEK